MKRMKKMGKEMKGKRKEANGGGEEEMLTYKKHRWDSVKFYLPLLGKRSQIQDDTYYMVYFFYEIQEQVKPIC